MFIRSTGEPVLAQVVGHSEHGDAYRCITYDRDGKTVLHDRASVRRLSLPRAPSPACPAQLVQSPAGEWGTVTWQTSPRGSWGTVFPGVGNNMAGGGGYCALLFFLCKCPLSELISPAIQTQMYATD